MIFFIIFDNVSDYKSFLKSDRKFMLKQNKILKVDDPIEKWEGQEEHINTY